MAFCLITRVLAIVLSSAREALTKRFIEPHFCSARPRYERPRRLLYGRDEFVRYLHCKRSCGVAVSDFDVSRISDNCASKQFSGPFAANECHQVGNLKCRVGWLPFRGRERFFEAREF